MGALYSRILRLSVSHGSAPTTNFRDHPPTMFRSDLFFLIVRCTLDVSVILLSVVPWPLRSHTGLLSPIRPSHGPITSLPGVRPVNHPHRLQGILSSPFLGQSPTWFSQHVIFCSLPSTKFPRTVPPHHPPSRRRSRCLFWFLLR